jgi:hypothetical protein
MVERGGGELTTVIAQIEFEHPSYQSTTAEIKVLKTVDPIAS